MLNISAWSIKNPILPIVLFVILTLLGVSAFNKLPITAMPNIDVPFVNVTMIQPGAAPSELEAQVTRRVENAVADIVGARRVRSTITEGTSVTSIEFTLGTPTDRAVNDVRDAVTKIRPDLPQEVQEPIVARLDIEGGAIVTYGVEAPAMSREQLSYFIDDTVIKALKNVKGAAQVVRLGGSDRQLTVLLQPEKLQAYNITAAELSRQLAVQNIDLAGGRLTTGGTEQSLRTLGGATSAPALADMRIALGNGNSVRLGDLATVTDAEADVRQSALLNGRQAVAFAVYRAKGASDVSVAQGIDTVVTDLSQRFPDIKFSQVDSMVQYSLAAYSSAFEALLEGTALAVVSVWLFLRNNRATIISALAIPLSVLPTFWVMNLLGFTLNGVSLFAIMLVSGVLVDDAIVEIENIVRHMAMGKRPYDAAIEAADEIGLAVVATSFTIMAVFLPVAFMGGIVGQYFRQFGLTVAVAVFISLLVARLITPLLAAYFLRPNDAHATHSTPFYIAPYARLLTFTLQHRWITLASAVVVLIGSFWLMGKLPAGFVPVEDRARSTLSLELPPGARLTDAEHMVQTITQKLQQRPEVLSVFAEVGVGGEVRKALLAIKLKSRKERALSQKQFEQDFAKTLDAVPDIRHAFTLGRSSAQRELTLELTGDNVVALDKTARTLAEQLRGIPSLVNLNSDAALNRPEIEITPNFEQAARLGISAQNIASAVRVATVGDFLQVVAKMRDGDRQIPIVVRLNPNSASDVRLIGNLPIRTNTGQTVLLKSVASIAIGTSPAQINRYNRERTISFAADLRTGTTLGAAMASIEQLPVVKNLPAGVRLPKSGDAETMGEMFSEFTSALGIGLMAVYAVLTVQFRSFLQSLTIMSALPMSIGGSAIALLLAGKGIEMPVVIGLLLLFGIVAKNSILLVDCAATHQKEGYSRTESLRQAGIQRARPILMTTIAMVAGMLPAVLGLGSASNEFRAPMAIAVIGGLLSATVLSLLFVPAIYALFDDIERILAHYSKRLLGDREEKAA